MPISPLFSCFFTKLFRNNVEVMVAVIHTVLRSPYALFHERRIKRMTAVVYLSFACKQNGFLL